MRNSKIIKYSTASLYVMLYVIVATISCICSIDFFNMTHNTMSSVILAISFEIGSMGCLFGALTTLRNKNNALIWIMFIFLTLMQMMNNTYYAYTNIDNYRDWVELFDIVELEEMTQKRIISIISGCVLPVVALSFIHLLVDLLREDIDKPTIELETPDEEDEYDEEVDNEENNDDVLHSTESENQRVFDAIPVTDNEIETPKRKSDIEDAREQMEIALKKLKDYSNGNNEHRE